MMANNWCFLFDDDNKMKYKYSESQQKRDMD